MQRKTFETFCCQFPLLSDFFNEEDQTSVHRTKDVKVKAARPGVKPANKQLRTTVGDKVSKYITLPNPQGGMHWCVKSNFTKLAAILI